MIYAALNILTENTDTHMYMSTPEVETKPFFKDTCSYCGPQLPS